jgi:hypothetical protein
MRRTITRYGGFSGITAKRVFREGVRIAARANLVGMVLHAVEGTTMKAKVATRNGWDRKELEGFLSRLDRLIDEAMKEVERLEEEETREYRLPEALEDRKKLRELIKDALKEMAEVDRDHLHPNDKEARIMKGDGWKRFAYNAQAIVDEASELVVGEDVVNDEGDSHLLTGMIDRVKDNLEESAAETVADGGYYSGEEIAKAEAKGYGVLVSLKAGAGKYHSSKFEYDPQGDVCTCPEGKELRYERTKLGREKRYMVRVYRCKSHKECPFRGQCSRDKGGRQIEISEYHQAVIRQRDKQRKPEKLEMLKKRKSIVERIFGQIKECMGFNRFMVNGLEGVKTQWSLLCTAVNLKRMCKWWQEGRLIIADVNSADRPSNSATLYSFCWR